MIDIICVYIDHSILIFGAHSLFAFLLSSKGHRLDSADNAGGAKVHS